MSESQKYFGKYRGTVVNNVDVTQMGRIMAIVPDVSAVALTSVLVLATVTSMARSLTAIAVPGLR